MQWAWEANTSAQVRSQGPESMIFSEFLLSVSNQINDNNDILEIIEYKKTRKEEEPKKKMNTSGALNIGGMSDFNPDANVRLTRSGEAEKRAETEKKKKKGCCGWYWVLFVYILLSLLLVWSCKHQKYYLIL